MTEKKKHFVSLSVKPLFVLLLGLVLGVCVCLLANFTGEQIIERSYLSEKAVLKRTNKAAQEFQSFVRQNGVSTRDTLKTYAYRPSIVLDGVGDLVAMARALA